MIEAEAVEIPTTPEKPLFGDIRALIASGMAQERPTVSELTGGRFALYAGRLNEIHAEPATGKTNIALAFALSTIRIRRHVVFLDPEDTLRGVVSRLLSFGCDPEQACEYFHHIQAPTPDDFRRAAEWSAISSPALVIADGLAELMAADCLDEDKPADVITLFQTRFRPFLDTGAAVLVSDHVVKSTENRGLWPRGSGAKMGRYDGAVYSAETIEPYTPAKAGAVRLRVAKDRCGGVGAKGSIVAELHFSPAGNGKTEISFRDVEDNPEFVPTGLMEKVSRRLEIEPDASLRSLREIGKAQYVDFALSKLEEGGHLKVTKQGAGRPTIYKLLKQYRAP